MACRHDASTVCWLPHCWSSAGSRRAGALESAPVASARATASLVSDTDTVAPGTPFRVGLRLRLAPGWHTYWQNPGDAGVPPELELDLPPGATAGPIAWPAPQRIAGGCADDLRLHRRRAAAGHRHARGRRRAPPCKAHANWLVCHEICVPEEGDFRLTCRPAPPPPRRRRRCSPRSIGRFRAPSPWQRGGRPRRHAVRAGTRTDAGHRGRCLVHSRRARARSATAPRSR